MNRTAAERRHHRERIIRNRMFVVDMHGSRKRNAPPGYFDKSHDVVWWRDDERVRGSYLARGYQKRDWWDGGDGFNVRARMKADLRREVEQLDEAA